MLDIKKITTTRYLIATFVLGAMFLVLKIWEWNEMKNYNFWSY